MVDSMLCRLRHYARRLPEGGPLVVIHVIIGVKLAQGCELLLSTGMATRSRGFAEDLRLGKALGHTLAFGVHGRQVELCVGVATTRRFRVPACRFCHVLIDARARGEHGCDDGLALDDLRVPPVRSRRGFDEGEVFLELEVCAGSAGSAGVAQHARPSGFHNALDRSSAGVDTRFGAFSGRTVL